MKEQKKIGVATVFTGYNYGSALQAFATVQILKKIGCDAELFKLRGSIVAGRDVRIGKLLTIVFRSLRYSNGRNAFKMYRKGMAKKLVGDSKARFDSFVCEMLHPTVASHSELKSRASSDEYKAFLCGSDQVWNSSALYVDPFYYLRFAPYEKRIAFAPSFGIEYVPSYNRKTIARYLSEMPYKSVREASGAEIIRELTGEEARVLLDPTLVLRADEWRRVLDIKKTNTDRYLLAYFLDTPSERAREIVLRISEKYGLKVIGLPYLFDDLKWDIVSAGPKEFVEYVNGADFICTDSFHGSAFALNFGIPFYAFKRNCEHAGKQQTRIESLLELVSAQDRFEVTDIDNCMQIDFERISEILDEKKKESYDYLKETIR